MTDLLSPADLATRAAPVKPGQFDVARLQLMDAAEAAAYLDMRACDGRGFLGLDPVLLGQRTLAERLVSMHARVYRHGQDLLGVAPCPPVPGYGVVSAMTTSAPLITGFTGVCRAWHGLANLFTVIDSAAAEIDLWIRAGFFTTGSMPRHFSRGDQMRAATVLACVSPGTCEQR